MTPPDHIDGARVLEWAWSDEPFGFVSQDAAYSSLDEAKAHLPDQYRRLPAIWQPWHSPRGE